MVFRKKGLLAVAIGSILGVASYNASATTFCIANTDHASCGSGSPKTIKFAKEIKADDTTKAYIPTGSGSVGGVADTTGFVNIVSPVLWGYAAAAGREFYVRIDLLSGGASGKARFVEAADITLALTAAGGAISANISLGANTSKGDAFVVFKVGTSKEIPLTAAIQFSMGPGAGIELLGRGDVDVVYSIANSEDVSPSNNTGSVRANLIKFEDSYTFAGLDPVTATSDVESNFLKFSNDKVTASIASFDFSKKAGVYVRKDSGASFAAVELATIFDFSEGKTTVDVLGDFTMVEDIPAGSGKYDNAKPKVYLSTFGDNCTETGKISATAVTATSAKFSSGSISGKYDVCVTANGVSAIPVGNYSVVLNPVGVNNRDATTAPQGAVYDVSGEVTLSDLGSIVRNGTQLITPYITTTSGYLSRVMLSNYGSRDISYTVRLVTDEGKTATAGVAATGTVKAGTLKQINASELVAFSDENKQRGAAIFTFVGASSDIQGIYQTVNLNTFDAQSVVMRRPGAGRGIQ